MANTEFSCLPTMIGSMPHTEAEAACSDITRYLEEIPCWPQLPRRSHLENMYTQFSEGFPGVSFSDGNIYIDRSQDIDKSLEALYAAYLENNISKYPISPDYAAGLDVFRKLDNLSPLAVKGQVTGPITWGLTVSDDSRRPILYDEVLGDAVAKFIKLKAGWQEKALRQISPNTIIFVDEPYMAAYGSSTATTLSSQDVISSLEEVFSGISGLKGIHCCGNTDWSVLLSTTTDIISFDAYNYAQSLTLYPAEVKKFLARKGAIAWGIVPSDESSLRKETVSSLKDRLEEAMAPFTRKDIPFRELIRQGLLTPSCGLATLPSPEAAARALELLVELSALISRRYM